MPVPPGLLLIAMNQDASYTPDLLGLYLDEAGSFPLLTKADEMRLGQIIQEGQTARAALDAPADGEVSSSAPALNSRKKRELRKKVAEAEVATAQFINAN